ncbi:serine hydrolase [Pedobacter sp. UBA4863]|uniref:serine hydrolase domain-containing protein n=1 Tax=Pedobacter sp. UBA4863 TaxID=1947060 RepID=UPI0025F10FB7|nr:serine hydrolase domain-containing protein [Pedobacter sp. UBA4863]
MRVNLKTFLLVILVSCLFACKKDSPAPLPPVVNPPVNPPGQGISLPQVDDDMNNFVAKYQLPGVSIAIVKGGKLVYAKGYGLADKETLTNVDTSSLFRIASLSKWITSTAIMKLVQEGNFTVNDKVFGTGAILGNTYGTQPYGPNITNITVNDLLHHTAGGWGNSSNDPMFSSPELNADDHISWVLNSVPLINQPGAVLDYSNVGFSILCRIIEKISGKPYEQYVRENIFKPAGIKNMQIGTSALSGRKPNEVKYYGIGTANPYGYHANAITRLGGVGGWIASPIDLMRFLVRVDGFDTVSDILTPQTLNIMSAKTANSGNYACGFLVSNNGNWYHGGTLTGTRAWMVKTTTGFSWAILINTSASGNLNTDLDKLIWPAVNNASTPWPTKDLFYP